MTRGRRFRVGIAVALVAAGSGLVLDQLALFAGSLVGITYAVYAGVGRPPEPTIAVDRTIDSKGPRPGEAVDVTVRVRNDGSTVVPDVRIVDAPPNDLVVEGSPRGAASLAPGETAAVEYAVRAKRGTSEFGDVLVRTSTVSGDAFTTERYDVEGTIDCDDRVDEVPLDGQTIQFTGRIDGDAGGEGVEFHATRAHQPSDPMNRVDWARLARTGELATIEFRQEQAVRLVCLVDARRSASWRRRPGESTASDLCQRVALHVATRLLATNNQVGVAFFGGSGHYLRPCSGKPQRARIERFLDGEWDDSFGFPNWLANGVHDVDRCCRHLADEKQILFSSPLLDDEPVEAARRFRTFRHDVTVVSPSVVPETPGGTVAGIVRDQRLSALRRAGVRVVEWSPDDSLHVALDRAGRRRSA